MNYSNSAIEMFRISIFSTTVQKLNYVKNYQYLKKMSETNKKKCNNSNRYKNKGMQLKFRFFKNGPSMGIYLIPQFMVLRK